MRIPVIGIAAVIILLVGGLSALACSGEVVQAGHSAAVTVFGKTRPLPYGPDFHVCVPWAEWHHYDCRQKTHTEADVEIPSQDQLTTTVDVSVQYHANPEMVVTMLNETGRLAAVVDTHLIPKLRSVLREQGKSVKKAEDFYLETTQQTLQATLEEALAAYCAPKGLVIEDVLIRDIDLPPFIVQAIEQKKEREQAAEREIAELDRFKTAAQQRTATAQQEELAAEHEAGKIKKIADAHAYEIRAQGEALRANPEVVRLRALERWDGVMPKVAGGADITLLLGLDGTIGGASNR